MESIQPRPWNIEMLNKHELLLCLCTFPPQSLATRFKAETTAEGGREEQTDRQKEGQPGGQLDWWQNFKIPLFL